MSGFSDECLRVFLKKQFQLFDEPVANNVAEAEAFLEECLAVVVDSAEEVREYLEESGMDVSGMTTEEVLESAEVFAFGDDQYLIVEG
ncbi:MAG: glyoxalase [Lachnospiraceae bacterium]|nr:glyoxalase [Lachnospiraceae bacterium]